MSLIANLIIFVVMAVLGGLGSAWYMVEHGSRLTTRQFGPWMIWTQSGKADADPYTRAHFARTGSLPAAASTERYYVAETDSEGRKLSSTCEYQIEGRGPNAQWWSLAVFDSRGLLIRNPADRYAFNTSTIIRGSGGTYAIALARDARPGNWLPTGGGGRLTVILSAYQLRINEQLADETAEGRELPSIRRVQCR